MRYDVIVANPRRVQPIAKSTKKNDRADAETLARLGRVDPTLLGPIAHRDCQSQADLAGTPDGGLLDLRLLDTSGMRAYSPRVSRPASDAADVLQMPDGL
jgi:hypothetical protein